MASAVVGGWKIVKQGLAVTNGWYAASGGQKQPPLRVGEGPNESAKLGEVAKNENFQNFGCSTD